MVAAERFWPKVQRTAGCWLWMNAKSVTGYGTFWHNGRMRRAHTFAWEQVNGPAPLGKELDHLCQVRNCVNPDHLEPVTVAENRRRSGMRKLNCPQGHPHVFGQPCRECKRSYNARRDRRRVLEVAKG